MKNLNNIHTPVEIRETVLKNPSKISFTRVLRALLIERRIPYRLQQTIEHILYTIGFLTKTVKIDGLRFKVRRFSWDEGFVHHVFDREDYTKNGFKIHESDTIIDIGANIGAFAVYAAKQVPLGRVIAFEPASDNFELLTHNATLNKFSNLITIRAAVAAHAGMITLYRGEGSGIHSTTKGHLTICKGTEQVEALSLEDVFKRYHINSCRLLKLNCEGAEYEILYSTPDYVLEKIQRITMEYHAKNNKRQKANELVDFLCYHKFKVIEYTDYVDLDCGFLTVEQDETINTQ